VVGDIHGRDHWKKIDPANYDRVIFMGDYADSHTIPAPQVIENLKEIILFRQSHPDKVILLLGNHDIQYSEFPRYRCSGFNELLQVDYTEIFRTHAGLFQVAWQYQNYLFTHAGVSHGFAKENLAEHYGGILSGEAQTAEVLNQMHGSTDQAQLHTVSMIRGGYDPFGGITWADYRETSRDILPGYHQVVGHTPRRSIETVGDALSSITYIDVLEAGGGFYELEI